MDNEGEKHMVMSSTEGVDRMVTAQVTEVSKPLMSFSKLVKAGNTPQTGRTSTTDIPERL